MTQLFHLADRDEWRAARAAGEYRISTRGVTLEEEGFIHCSLRHQVRGVAEGYYADADDLVLLIIDSAQVPSPIRYEAPADGLEEYPHIYGPLPASAVTAVVPLSRYQEGRLILPELPAGAERPDR